MIGALVLITVGLALLSSASAPDSNRLLRHQHVQLNEDLPPHVRELIRNSKAKGVNATDETTAECEDVWHMSVDEYEGNTCTNSGIYPKSWENPAVYKYLFYPSATKCCEGYFGVDHESLCTVVNACSDDSDSDETISKLDIVQATPKPSFAKTSRPTKPPLTRNPSKPPVTRSPSKPPTTRHPTKPPLTRSPTSSPMKAETEPEETGTAENSTPSMDSSCGANGFHVSLTAGEKMTCRNDDNHPSAWLEEGVKDSFMFASGAACCEHFFQRPDCNIIDNCENASESGPTPEGCGTDWHPSIVPGDIRTCTNSLNIPKQWFYDEMRSEFLFSNPEQCCTMFFPGKQCSVVNACKGFDMIDEVVNEASELSTECVGFHPSITIAGVCTNSPHFPASWPDAMFRDSPSECCTTFFQNNNCVVIDECSGANEDDTQFAEVDVSSPSKLEGLLKYTTSDGFEGDAQDDTDVEGFDWNLGNPQQWFIDDTVSYAGTRSITNVPTNIPSGQAELSLQVDIVKTSLLQCKALVKTSMPFDSFYIVVNGDRSNTHYTDNAENTWVHVTATLKSGKNLIQFVVANSHFMPPIERDPVDYGTGSVWLDECVIHYSLEI
jgi:hypothetical protein